LNPLNPNSAAPVSILPWRRRAPWLAVVAYVVVLSVYTDGGRATEAWFASLLGIACVLFAMRQDLPVVRVAGWGLAIVLASLGARAESRGLDAFRTVGVLACAAAGSLALSRIAGGAGLVRVQRTSPFPWVIAMVVTACLAVGARLAPRRGAFSWMGEGERWRVWLWLANAVTAFALLGSTASLLRTRSLELGVVERATAIRALLGTLLVTALVLAVVGRVRPEGVASLALAAAGVLMVASAQHPDAVRVGQAVRRALVLTIAGGGVALLGASVAAGSFAADAWLATMVTAVAAVAVGAAAAALEAPMRPAGGAWLDALARAREQAACAEPEDAIREALLALRAPGGPGSPSPELWTFSPTALTTVDAAGYLHERQADLPETLVIVAAAETEATLRIEVLEALEVRRPEIRPLLKWMTDRRAILATVVAWAGETEGVLVMPRAGRTEAITLEEVEALRKVADRLAIACRARGTQVRMLARAAEAAERAEAAEDRAETLVRERALDLTRNALAAARLARPATVGIHSAASRAALDALERRTSAGAPLALVAPSGGDPVPYLARAHLSGARARGPLVLVDGTNAREHDVARWTDAEASPLALADGGMLVLLDGAALPAAVQQLVARACADQRPPWDDAAALDVQLALTGIETPGELVEKGRLDPALAARLADARDAPIALPRLRDRTEDVRAILTDSLARQGMRVLGRPVGIDHAAYARLVEHEFPGEDAELAALVERMVSRCAEDPGRDVVKAADLEGMVTPG
jgi:hypothetical protein